MLLPMLGGPGELTAAVPFDTPIVSLGRWGLDTWSFALIEVTVLALAFVGLREAWRQDRADRAARHAMPRTTLPGTGGLVGRPSEIAGAVNDSPGAWPRLSFLVRAIAFTFVLEALLSHGFHADPADYIAVEVADRVPYHYPEGDFLLSVIGVPIWIPIGWALIFRMAMITSDRLVSAAFLAREGILHQWFHGAAARAAMDAALALLVDLSLDPIATSVGWWVWTPRIEGTLMFGVPVSNFVAWFAIVFAFSLFTRTGRMFTPYHRGRRGAWASRAISVAILAITPAASFVTVIAVVKVAYQLDQPRWEIGSANSAVLVAMMLFAAATLALVSALPLGTHHALDRVTVRSAVALHAVFVVVMVWLVLSDGPPHDGPSALLVPAPRAEGIVLDGDVTARLVIEGAGRRVTVEPLAAHLLVTGAAIAVDPPESVPGAGAPHALLIAPGRDPLGQPPLLDAYPELSLWIPGVAIVSLLLFLGPYLGDVRRSITAPPRVEGRHVAWRLIATLGWR